MSAIEWVEMELLPETPILFKGTDLTVPRRLPKSPRATPLSGFVL